jgi:acetolactate synthase small subunit
MAASSPAHNADTEPFRTTPTPTSARARVACFSIHAEADPGVMPRVLGLFAKRGLVPRRWVSDVTGPDARELAIDVQVAGLDPETQAYIARCLRQVWGVGTVLTSEKGGA